MKKVLIVGSGISSLAIAEIFARNNYKVTVAEQHANLGGVSSLAIQNWFHTGNLYAFGKSNHTFSQFEKSRKLFAKLYPVNNQAEGIINIDNEGIPYNSNLASRWFDATNPIYFCLSKIQVPFGGKPVSDALQKIWFKNIMLNRLINRKMPFTYAEVPLTFRKFFCETEGLNEVLNNSFVIKGTDTTMYSKNIMNTLVELGKESGVEYLVNVKIEQVSNRKHKVEVLQNGSKETYDQIFFCTGGNNIPLKTNSYARMTTGSVTSFFSPVLVLNKKICDHSFVLVSSNKKNFYNHLLYQPTPQSNKQFSTFGSYINIKSFTQDIKDKYIEECMHKFKFKKEDIAGCYWGLKPEYTKPGLNRNYTTTFNRIENNIYHIMPGKFSLFPLLVKEAIETFGLSVPGIEASTILNVGSYVKNSKIEDALYTPEVMTA